MRQDELTLADVAELTHATLRGNPDRVVRVLSHPRQAQGADLTFLDGRYPPSLLGGSMPAVLLPEAMSGAVDMLDALVCAAPQQALLQVAAELWRRDAYPPAGVHPTAVIGSGVVLGEGCFIGPFCVVERGARIGAGSAIHSHAVIGARACIGEGSHVGANASVGAGTVLGRNCVVHAGAVVGFAQSPMPRAGSQDQAPNFGRVVLGDEVEIGPNCVVQCGESRITAIDDGACVGPLSMVGHDSHVERGARLVSMVGLAGESHIGANALLLGQVGVSSVSSVGADAVVLAKSGVDRDVPAGTVVMGIPARPRREWLPALAAFRSVPRLARRLRALQQRIQHLEERES